MTNRAFPAPSEVEALADSMFRKIALDAALLGFDISRKSTGTDAQSGAEVFQVTQEYWDDEHEAHLTRQATMTFDEMLLAIGIFRRCAQTTLTELMEDAIEMAIACRTESDVTAQQQRDRAAARAWLRDEHRLLECVLLDSAA